MRRAVRLFLKYGVDRHQAQPVRRQPRRNRAAGTAWMSDEEVAVACARPRFAASASPPMRRSCGFVKQCLRHGIEVIYHASFTDTRRSTCWRA
jgi:hypothetical protein